MCKKFKLKLTTQCAKCPWKVSTNPYEIPGEYSKELHENLSITIADPHPKSFVMPTEIKTMACHLTHNNHCIGYLYNQLGYGNNLALIIKFMNCENLEDMKIIGPQHETFQDTLPQN